MRLSLERLQNATIIPEPALAVEGLEVFSLRSSVQQGEVERRRWFWDGEEIRSTSPHYSLQEEQLLIHQLKRGDTGSYSLQLLNPLSEVKVHLNLTVLCENYTPLIYVCLSLLLASCVCQYVSLSLYLPNSLCVCLTLSVCLSLRPSVSPDGPDEPVLEVLPTRPFYETGDSVILSCRAEGHPVPSADWLFGGVVHPGSQQGVLTLTNLLVAQGGTYTCQLRNELSEKTRNISLLIYGVYYLSTVRCTVYPVESNTTIVLPWSVPCTTLFNPNHNPSAHPANHHLLSSHKITLTLLILLVMLALLALIRKHT